MVAPIVKVLPPVVVNAINIYTAWSGTTPVVGRTEYMPVLVLAADDPVPLDTPPNTVILRVIST